MYVVDTYNGTLLELEYNLDRGSIGEPKTVLHFKGKEGMAEEKSIFIKESNEENVLYFHFNYLKFQVN